MPPNDCALLRPFRLPTLLGLFAAPATAAATTTVAWDAASAGPTWAWVLGGLLNGVALLLAVRAVRRHRLVLHRLFGRPRHPGDAVVSADWPPVTVLVVGTGAGDSPASAGLAAVDYPAERLTVVPVRSHPGPRIAPRSAIEATATEIVVVLAADQCPTPALIRRLAAPFLDPEVGAVTGRAVPSSIDTGLLARLDDLARTAHEQIGQQGRMNLGQPPRLDDTVIALRRSAVAAVGGWRDDVPAPGEDLARRLQRDGWTTVYQHHAACLTATPSSGDGASAAGDRVVPVVIGLAGALLYLTVPLAWLTPALLVAALLLHGGTGRIASGWEIAAAARLERTRQRVRLIAFHGLGAVLGTVRRPGERR